jgi:hypothetical protein
LKVSHHLNFGIIWLKVGTPRVLVYHPFIHLSKVFQFKENLGFGVLNNHSQVIRVQIGNRSNLCAIIYPKQNSK